MPQQQQQAEERSGDAAGVEGVLRQDGARAGQEAGAEEHWPPAPCVASAAAATSAAPQNAPAHRLAGQGGPAAAAAGEHAAAAHPGALVLAVAAAVAAQVAANRRLQAEGKDHGPAPARPQDNQQLRRADAAEAAADPLVHRQGGHQQRLPPPQRRGRAPHRPRG